ncbi:hypothetical protein FB451DRAFT_164027 [Mycena latifolia]|nr:hypothetical protein FB451DRAFT_164027 [Mycena latifolia]
MSVTSSKGPTEPISAGIMTDQDSLDNDRLIPALQACFSELIKKQEEQTDRLEKAVEALKPPALPVTDMKTSFWNSYMKLADEHDKEFQRKYSTDLDTALIFAGLFSAVSSAFIIQIQPQLMTDPLKIIVIAQSLLYTSLFATLLAALLAVLGKQWIMAYEAAGSRGTIEERGLERQRKLDGLRRWKLEGILQMFPLLLQLAVFLFSTALSIYLWTVHHGIAIVVLALTCSGFAAYILILVSAIMSPDSPFQTPLATFITQVIPRSIIKQRIVAVRRFFGVVSSRLFGLINPVGYVLPSFIRQSSLSNQSTPNPSDPGEDFFYSPPPLEGPAVLWVLETSTDPTVITVAAEMANDLQWQLDTDLTSPMVRLLDIFTSCFEFVIKGSTVLSKIRTGMERRAFTCGRAFCSLRLVARASGHSEIQFRTAAFPRLSLESEDVFHQVRNVVEIITEWPIVHLDSISSAELQWALHIIPSLRSSGPVENILDLFLDQFQPNYITRLDSWSFANYLCCVNSFFSPTSPRVMTRLDKRKA